jgi:hypothetical protein
MAAHDKVYVAIRRDIPRSSESLSSSTSSNALRRRSAIWSLGDFALTLPFLTLLLLLHALHLCTAKTEIAVLRGLGALCDTSSLGFYMGEAGGWQCESSRTMD